MEFSPLSCQHPGQGSNDILKMYLCPSKKFQKLHLISPFIGVKLTKYCQQNTVVIIDAVIMTGCDVEVQ